MLSNRSLNIIFNNNLSLSKFNKMEKEINYLQASEKLHEDLYLQDKYPFLKFTPENLKTFQLGYLEGLKKGMEETFEEMLTPTIVRNDVKDIRAEALAWAKKVNLKILPAAYEHYGNPLTEEDLICLMYPDRDKTFNELYNINETKN